MTPLQIQMMLHYYAICEPYAADRPAHAGSLAVISQRDQLCNIGMLQSEVSDSGFSVTEKGRAYVEAVCAVQIPVCKWVQPC